MKDAEKRISDPGKPQRARTLEEARRIRQRNEDWVRKLVPEKKSAK